jgi:cytochrome P450
MGNVPLQMWWFSNAVSKWLLERFGPAELQKFPNFLKWLETRIEERMKTGLNGRRKDMLQQFIEMKGSDSSPHQSAPKEEVLVEATVVLGAGADTTSHAIQGVLGDLVMHPDLVPKIQSEIDQAYKDLGLTTNGTEISYNDATKLPYLAAVIKESIRLSPSFVYQIPRFTPAEGLKIGPHHLPKGLYAGISPRAMNRSKEIFGEDADDFVPERWLPSASNNDEAIKEKSRLLTTFGMGTRVCIGQNIALVEIYKFTAQFVRHFELEVVNRDKPWTTKSATFAFRSDFWVKLKTRQVTG